MARKKSEFSVFSHIGPAEGRRDGHRFVPSGNLGLTETDGANVHHRELASEFAYGELDPVSLAFGDRQGIKGKLLFPINGLG